MMIAMMMTITMAIATNGCDADERKATGSPQTVEEVVPARALFGFAVWLGGALRSCLQLWYVRLVSFVDSCSASRPSCGARMRCSIRLLHSANCAAALWSFPRCCCGSPHPAASNTVFPFSWILVGLVCQFFSSILRD